MTLDSIISVSIDAQTAFPTQRGFGTPLFMAYHTRFAENFRSYASLNEMIADGFTVNESGYLMAAAAFAQNPSLPEIKIGRLPTPGSAYTVELDNTGGSAPFTATITDEAGNTLSASEDTPADLAVALDAFSGVSAAFATGTITIDADTNGPMFFISGLSEGLEFTEVTGDWGVDTALAAILLEDSDFYAVACSTNSATNIADVAAWANSNGRIAGFAPHFTDPADYDTAANALRDATNNRAFSIPKKDGRRGFAECAWLGEALPYDPGSQTWAFKTLSGVVTDPWTTSEINTLEAQNSNHYTRVSGLSLTRNGEMHGGEFIDVTRGLDWVKVRIQERVLALLANNRKVPFTAAGKAQIDTAIRSVLQQGVENEVLVEGFILNVPNPSDVPSSDRAARRWTGITFTATLAGAVHSATVQGAVSV